MAKTDQWSVVMFEDDNCVAVVPNTWVFEGSDGKYYCYWPLKTQNASLLAKRRVTPDSNWPQYKSKILGGYDDYQTAVHKSRVAEDTSDLSSHSESKRKRKKKLIYTESEHETSTEEKSDISDEETYPTLPQFKKTGSNNSLLKRSKVGNHKTIDEREKTSRNSNTEDISNVSTPKNLRMTPVNLPGSSTCLTPIVYTDFQRQVLNKLNIINARLQQHEETFDIIIKLLESNTDKNIVENVDPNYWETWFPIDTDDDLIRVEVSLGDNVNIINMAKGLSRIGGDSVEMLTRKILYRIMTNNFGQNYSWEGGKGKKKFVELKLSRVILKAIQLNAKTANSTDAEVIKTIKTWLAKAKEREMSALKKLNQSGDRLLP